jgi:hypothetical protein
LINERGYGERKGEGAMWKILGAKTSCAYAFVVVKECELSEVGKAKVNTK